nr:GntR family transcriptional regulator [Corynebacterium lactis]
MSTPERIRDILGIGTEASPLHQPAVADTAAATLRQEILNGQHFSGEQLREAQLAARLKVSRNSIARPTGNWRARAYSFTNPITEFS